MEIVLSQTSFFSRSHAFCLVQSKPINLQQYRGETGAFYNLSSKYIFIRYSYEFNILISLLVRTFSCLVYFIVIFLKALKSCYFFAFISCFFSFNTAVVSPCKQSYHLCVRCFSSNQLGLLYKKFKNLLKSHRFSQGCGEWTWFHVTKFLKIFSISKHFLTP